MPSPSETTAAAETKSLDDGGPAYPNPGYPSMRGMSLRQWYAGQALASLAAVLMKAAHDAGESPETVGETIAGLCLELADSLIAAERARAVL